MEHFHGFKFWFGAGYNKKAVDRGAQTVRPLSVAVAISDSMGRARDQLCRQDSRAAVFVW